MITREREAARARAETEVNVIKKRKADEEAQFRRANPAAAALLEYARASEKTIVGDMSYGRALARVDTEAYNLQQDVDELRQRIVAAEKAYDEAKQKRDALKARLDAFQRSNGPQRIKAAHEKADALLSNSQFHELRPADAATSAPPYFVAADKNTATSICGCAISFKPAHIGEHEDDCCGGFGTKITKVDVPDACYHKLCAYHTHIDPVADEDLCTLFCAAMADAGYPVPAHRSHACTSI